MQPLFLLNDTFSLSHCVGHFLYREGEERKRIFRVSSIRVKTLILCAKHSRQQTANPSRRTKSNETIDFVRKALKINNELPIWTLARDMKSQTALYGNTLCPQNQAAHPLLFVSHGIYRPFNYFPKNKFCFTLSLCWFGCSRKRK